MYTSASVLPMEWLQHGEAGPQGLKEGGRIREILTNRPGRVRRLLVNIEKTRASHPAVGTLQPVSLSAPEGVRRARSASRVRASTTGPDILDDTTDDYERLETELVAQNRDAARVSTANVNERSARRLVDELIEDDVVTPVPDQRVLVHEPSDAAFDSTTQLAVFHRGWQAATDADAEDD
jgi:hypothetical protein